MRGAAVRAVVQLELRLALGGHACERVARGVDLRLEFGIGILPELDEAVVVTRSGLAVVVLVVEVGESLEGTGQPPAVDVDAEEKRARRVEVGFVCDDAESGLPAFS